jgi:hypothetical protein
MSHFIFIYIAANKCWTIRKRQWQKYNSEKLATYGTQDSRRRQSKLKYNTICEHNHNIAYSINRAHLNNICLIQTVYDYMLCGNDLRSAIPGMILARK